MDKRKSPPKAFLIYCALLLAGLGYYQHTQSGTGLRSYRSYSAPADKQRQEIVGLTQPESWQNYASDSTTFRNSLTSKTDYLLNSPAGYTAFLAAKARVAVRDSVAPFDSKLAELEGTATATFNDIGYTPKTGPSGGGVMVVGSSMRRNTSSSYSSSSSSSSGYSSSSSYSHK